MNIPAMTTQTARLAVIQPMEARYLQAMPTATIMAMRPAATAASISQLMYAPPINAMLSCSGPPLCSLPQGQRVAIDLISRKPAEETHAEQRAVRVPFADRGVDVGDADRADIDFRQGDRGAARGAARRAIELRIAEGPGIDAQAPCIRLAEQHVAGACIDQEIDRHAAHHGLDVELTIRLQGEAYGLATYCLALGRHQQGGYASAGVAHLGAIAVAEQEGDCDDDPNPELPRRPPYPRQALSRDAAQAAAADQRQECHEIDQVPAVILALKRARKQMEQQPGEPDRPQRTVQIPEPATARTASGAHARAACACATPIMESRPTMAASRSSDQPSVPPGRKGSTR